MRKSWRMIAVTALVALAVFALGAPVQSGGGKVSEAFAQPVWSQSSLEQEYGFGTVLTVPERTVTVDDKSAKATSVVEYPDGSATRKTEVTLNMDGVYTLTYTAVIDGQPYAETETFKVIDKLVNVSSGDSSVTYGKYQYANSAEGLMIRLADGDTATFTPIIDVSKLTMSDVLVEGFATPDVKGQVDFRRLYYTFTDVSDPSVYMRVSVRQSNEGDDYPISYYLAGGNGQPLVGYEEVWDRLHIDNEWGAQARHSFSLQFGPNFTEQAPDDMPMSIRYDASSVSVYTGGIMIIDFDNPKFFSTLWKGFPSGKVRMSITAGMYNSSSANFCITKLHGVDLTAEKFLDGDKPVITVDNKYDKMPEAKKGMSYPIPSATAYDLYSGDCEVKTSVWYNYTSTNAVLTPIADGRFVTDRVGDYAIVYEATDNYGNTASEVLWVHASENIALPEIEITGTPDAEIAVGELIEPVEHSEISYSGDASVSITAELDGEVFAADNGFRAEKAGVYTVKYTVTDFIGQSASDSYTVTVKMGSTPVFVDKPVMPFMFISGSEYVLPELYANDYRSGSLQRKLATAEITDANGTVTVKAGEKFTPEVDADGDNVEVVFKCEGAEYSLNIPAVKVWEEEGGRPRLHLENYLIGNGVSYSKNTDSITVTAVDSAGGWMFANDMIAYSFDLQIKGAGAKSKFESLVIIMADAENPECAIQAELINNNSKAEIKVGDTTVGLSGSFLAGTTYSVGYSEGQITLGSAKLDIDKTIDGKPFEDFASGRLLVGVYFKGAQPGAAYELVSVNGHIMNNSTTDRIAPKIVVYGDHGGSYSLGDKVTLPVAAASDVADPNVMLTMSVTDGNGKIMTDVNGLKLENVDPTVRYTIELKVYGQHNITIKASDTFNQRNNERTYSYVLNVDDNVAPEFTFSGDFQTSAKVGDALVIPDFTVSDNLTEADKIIVTKYALTPSGLLVTIPEDSNSIKATQPGDYEFRLIAMDENGNVNMIRKTVTVTA